MSSCPSEFLSSIGCKQDTLHPESSKLRVSQLDCGEVKNVLCFQSQNSVNNPDVILIGALPNAEGQQQYQLLREVKSKPATLISQGSELSTLTSVQLEIGFEKSLPSGNVQAKTWVPEKEVRRSVKRLTADSLTTVKPKEEVKDTNNCNEKASKVDTTAGKSVALSQDTSKDTLVARIKDFIKIHDKPAQPRAFAVLPLELQYQRGLVSPRRAMPACVRFGPVEGINECVTRVEAQELISVLAGTPIFFLTSDYGDNLIHINHADTDKSNWMGLLPLGDERTANVWIHECDNQLYGLTLQPIAASTPLRFGYSTEYAEKYGIVGPTIDILAELQNVRTPSHSCKECSRMFLTKRLLELHHGKYHARTSPGRGPYCCRLCRMRFTRMFALRRHQRLTCTKMKEKTSKITSPTKPQKSEIQNGGFPQQNGADDSNRLPSDESLQNYTNILDISTNLFDTDRMPNLDISGSVKSDNEFNPLGFKDDSHLANDFCFSNGLMDDLVVGDTPNAKKSLRKPRSSSPFSCPYCKINIPRSKLKQHSKNCMAQRFVCVCGRKYRLKGKMEAHIRVCDSVKNSKVLDNPYSCAECNITFKRRGMYVNHLTTRHSGVAAVPETPLVVPDRRFPCPDCNKLYKTQAKRHAHVLSRHPGIKYNQTKVLVCGSKSLQPAKCWVCPKQYVTRAKLLQHARRHHPNSEPPARFSPSPKKAR